MSIEGGNLTPYQKALLRRWDTVLIFICVAFMIIGAIWGK